MKLATYLAERDLTDAEFAAFIGRHASTVCRLRKGETQPDWKTVEVILQATDGAVTPNDFLSNTTDREEA